MSHIPAVVAQIAQAAREAADSFGHSPGRRSLSLSGSAYPDRVPLSERPANELHARAAELRCMASTARTADAKTALETLATRFAALAARREVVEALEAQPRARGSN